jgi:hypothetical protein
MTTVELSKFVKKETYGNSVSWWLNYLGHAFNIFDDYADEDEDEQGERIKWTCIQCFPDSHDQGDYFSGNKEVVQDDICFWFQNLVAESMPFVEVKFIWKENYDS